MVMESMRTASVRETKKIAADLAYALARERARRRARVVALRGPLGAGKTAFAQGFSEALGVREPVRSPTFIIMQIYALPRRPKTNLPFRELVHVDAYRLSGPAELTALGFERTLRDKNAVIIVEWADRVRKLLPKDALWIRFRHGKKENERVLAFEHR